MFSRRKAATKRFNLLLLEDEEYYVADWVASCRWPPSVSGNWQGAASLPGRLRLCTKSLFFDPDDVRVPIVRLEFSAVVQLEAENMQSCVVGVNKVTKMKANMADEPYVVEKGGGGSSSGSGTSQWVFTLTYAKLDSFMPAAQEQLVMSRLPAAERLPLLDAAVKAREDASTFDTSRLVEFSERLLWEGPVLGLSPLVREPGRLAITDQRVYFQPLHNIAGDMLVRSHPLAAVAAVARRRSSLRPVGLELFMISPGPLLEQQQQQQYGLQQQQQQQHSLQQQQQLVQMLSGPSWDAPSAFFTFRSQSERDKALATITAQPLLGAAVTQLTPPPDSSTSSSSGSGAAQQQQQQQHQTHAQQQLAAAGALLEANSTWLHRVMMAWQLGKITNFDYLLYLNLAAGRSFNDLAQWPVFPWVLSDYKSEKLDLSRSETFRDLSKPMGALTPSRLEVFRRRYHDMESLCAHVDAAGDMPKPFMYGTHYSTPGYVMYWLVRAAPGHMLRLQGGKFDAPDRLFNSLGDSWVSATTSTTDVKELIPEFYMPGGDFLVNGSQLALGVRQSGRPVNNVELPPWASGPEDMLAQHRAALESPYVSAHLHEWIDLIFGHKQTGPAAVEADNVFYHLTYEGAVDISKVTGLNELRALETQINEFGQTPKQLFAHPHPPRLVTPPAPDPATVFSTTAATTLTTTPAAGAAGVGVGGTAAAAAAAAAGNNTNSSSTSPEPGGATRSAAAAAASGVQQGGGGVGGGRLSPALPSPPGRAPNSSSSAVSSSSSKVRLKGGGEDAAGGAICFALLSTILAAAAPEIEPTPAMMGLAPAAAAAAGGAVGGSAAAAAAKAGGEQSPGGGGDGGDGGGLQLSPVSSCDLNSAAPCSGDSPAKGAAAATPQQQQQQQRGLASSNKAAGAAAAGSQQQQQQQQGLRGMLSKLTEGAAAAAGSAAASVASAVQNTTASSSSSSNTRGAGGLPLPVLPVMGIGGGGGGGGDGSKPGGGGGGSSMLASLSWMQQQLAEGLSLRSNSSSSTASTGESQGTTSAAAAATRSKAAAASINNSSTVAHVHGASSSSSSSVNSSRQWPSNLPDKLLVRKSIRLQSEPLTAVAASPDGGSALFVAGHSGLLRVLDSAQLATHRSMKLDTTDLLCLSLLPVGAGASGAGSGSRAESPAAGLEAAAVQVPDSMASLPLLLAGAQSGRVLSYAATAGRVVGSWAAHEDAVSTILQLSSSSSTSATTHGSSSSSSAAVPSSCRLATASWDCSVKVWEVAEGRQPWSSTLPLPLLELRDLESGVWALAGSASGQLLVTGTEEGVVAAWDLRTRQQIWATQVSSDYVGGLSLLPGGNYVAAAAADGTLSLLEWRRAGERIASASCGSPLRCCSCDGQLMLAGTESGQLLMWNLAQMTGEASSAGFSLAGPDGLYPALSCPSKAPVNCVAVAVGGVGSGGGGGRKQQQADVAAALDDGSLVLFRNY